MIAMTTSNSTNVNARYLDEVSLMPLIFLLPVMDIGMPDADSDAAPIQIVSEFSNWTTWNWRMDLSWLRTHIALLRTSLAPML